MSLNISSGVPDETPYELLNDSVNLIGSTTINGVAYGIMFTFYGICVHYTIHKTQRADRRRAWLYLAYMSVMFALGTLYTASNARTIQLAYVNHRLFEAGPAVYDDLIYPKPVSIFGSASDVILSIMTSALMLWRFVTLYQGCGFYRWIIAFPCLLFLAVVGKDLASPYTTIIAILVESAALYAVWSLIFLVLYVINHPVQYVFMASLSQVQIITPLLITLRVSQGKAWSSKTNSKLLSTFKAGDGQLHTSTTIEAGEAQGPSDFESTLGKEKAQTMRFAQNTEDVESGTQA
ncbi:hypothetical protein HYDPIDRAFT_88626 [Hydnomerulius pinastri MD-312]|nr:hypothetical protein HYDPIDRAFT_88626 [Hydnomerulius pinastri MD-312]